MLLYMWLCVLRVEGHGGAVITDVIYSSETRSEEEKPSSQTKEKYESIKVLRQIQNLHVIFLYTLICIIHTRLR